MEQADCLLLNGNGKPVSLFPLSIINWKTAVKLFLTREVFLIKEYKDEFEVTGIDLLNNSYSKLNYQQSEHQLDPELFTD